MATEEELEKTVEELQEKIDEAVDDTSKWSQEESVDILETLASHCSTRANTIRSEMG